MNTVATGPLIGRDEELAAVGALLDAARAGRSGVLCLTGPPGIGKSALLDVAAVRADDLTVLRACGAEAESGLAFAGLSQVVLPLRRHLDALPGTQADALCGALAVGPATASDRFAPYVAFLGLLGHAAEEQPLLLLVDDAHWLDEASAEALAFASRRLEAEGVAVLVAARDIRSTPFRGLPEWPLGGVDEEAAAALIETVSHCTPDATVALALQGGTAGNPLALLELASSLSNAQLEGRAPLDDPLPVGARLEEAYGELLERLPGQTRRALLTVAAGEGRSSRAVTAALLEIGEPEPLLEPAEAAGLIVVEEARVRFRHPLVRSACYQAASPSERRAAHRLLAGVEEDADSRAWHLAAATVETDDAVAMLLAETARRARERYAHVEAAGAFERAARLTADGALSVERLIDAVRELQAAGRFERALALLHEAEAGAAEAGARAEIRRLRAQVEMWRGQPLRSYVLLTEEAERLASRDPVGAADLFLEAILPAILGGVPRDLLAACQNAERLVGQDHPLVSLGLGAYLTAVRREREASPYLERAVEFLEASDPLAMPSLIGPAVVALSLCGRHDQARGLVARVLAAARVRDITSVLPSALSMAAIVDYWRGRWREAYANGSEAVRLAQSMGQATDVNLTWLLFVEAGMGRERDTRAHAEEALTLIAQTGNTGVSCWVYAALGILELGLGNHDAAVDALEESRRAVPAGAQQTPEWIADLAEACLRAGRESEAAGYVEWLAGWAEENEHALGRALVARLHLLSAGDDDLDRWYQAAVAQLAKADVPFERARVELYHGERLRRARRLTEARSHLARAVDAFSRLGAVPWGDRAEAELRASGGAARRDDEASLAELTPRELQVALAVADGATNREAATRLLLSPKTVAFHLNNAYRKLGIASRVELAVLLSTDGATERAT